MAPMSSEWQSLEHALTYLRRADKLPHRAEGEDTLLAEVPENSKRVLDLGCGDGRLLALVLLKCSGAEGIALDFSPPMLAKARARFAENSRIQVIEHDLAQPLPALGSFDAIVSSFAIHHVSHERKRQVYEEIWSLLLPGAIFCNLEHVSSPNARVHERFLQAFGITAADEDPSNQLLDVQTQLGWLREIGFADVDCYWKWRELALLVGRKGTQL
jgi:tRNA (cmo5U34)-methyltransferase